MINKNYIKNRPNLRVMIILAFSALISWIIAMFTFIVTFKILVYYLLSEGLDENGEAIQYQPIFQYIIACAIGVLVFIATLFISFGLLNKRVLKKEN